MMKFEWHEQKNRLNVQKHKISFEIAMLAFSDPLQVSIQDRFENGEERWQILGIVQGQLLLLVAHTIQDSESGEVIRLISARLHVGQTRRSVDVMKQQTDLVKYEFDPANPPALTDKQKAKLAELAALPDEAIDYSDIPATSEQDWQGAQIGRFYRPIKKQVTVRIDADVLAWLQASGTGYQTRLNKILRDAMVQASTL